jgi:hypothetical protein
MTPSGLKTSTFIFSIFALLFCAQVFPRIQGDSLTADEPTDITNGYYYLTKGDTRTPHNHPPVAGALTSWPLLFMHLKTFPLPNPLDKLPYVGPHPNIWSQEDVIDRAHHFLFDWNLESLAEITFWTRLTSLGLGLGVGFLLFWVLRKEPWWLLGALGLWAFDPLLGALSGLAKTDIAPAFFFFLAVLAFQRASMKTSPEPPLTAGVLTALAVGCKFYGLVLLPLFALLEWFNERERFKPRPFTGKVAQSLLRRWGLGTTGFLLTLFLIYLPATLGLPDHPWPWNSLSEKLGEDLAYAAGTHPVFFLGQAGVTSHWYYLPCAFVLKEPIPLLALLGLILLLALKKRLILPAWQWVPPLVFTLALLGAPNLGVRYLLPAFPFLFLLGGRAFAWMFQAEHGTNARAWRLAALGFLAWQVLSVGLQAPRALSYFNDWVPADQRMFLLGDSNLDWGQDLKRLASEAEKRGWGRVKLAYYGAVDPRVYGLDWEPWTGEDLKGPQDGQVYAVNASFFQLAPIAYPPARPIAQSWIQALSPAGRVGDTWFYFEIPGNTKGGVNGKRENKKKYLLSAPFLQTRGYAFAALP